MCVVVVVAAAVDVRLGRLSLSAVFVCWLAVFVLCSMYSLLTGDLLTTYLT